MPSGACCGSGNTTHHTIGLMNQPSTNQEQAMSTVSTTVNVSGMTCGHCVSSVSEELEALAGVEKVDVDLNSGGISTVTITRPEPCPPPRSAKPWPRRATWWWPTRPEHRRRPTSAQRTARSTRTDREHREYRATAGPARNPGD